MSARLHTFHVTVTEDERASKLKEITCLITQKEKELSDLQSQKNVLNALSTSQVKVLEF